MSRGGIPCESCLSGLVQFCSDFAKDPLRGRSGYFSGGRRRGGSGEEENDTSTTTTGGALINNSVHAAVQASVRKQRENLKKNAFAESRMTPAGLAEFGGSEAAQAEAASVLESALMRSKSEYGSRSARATVVEIIEESQNVGRGGGRGSSRGSSSSGSSPRRDENDSGKVLNDLGKINDCTTSTSSGVGARKNYRGGSLEENDGATEKTGPNNNHAMAARGTPLSIRGLAAISDCHSCATIAPVSCGVVLGTSTTASAAEKNTSSVVDVGDALRRLSVESGPHHPTTAVELVVGPPGGALQLDHNNKVKKSPPAKNAKSLRGGGSGETTSTYGAKSGSGDDLSYMAVDIQSLLLRQDPTRSMMRYIANY